MELTMDLETKAWLSTEAEHLWVMDKLILARTMGYICGPTGLNVPYPGEYIVRPCVNMLGLGLGAQKVFLEQSTDHLPLGHFWCEWFDGEHYSVDYFWGQQELAVEGIKNKDTFTQWDLWIRKDKSFPFPDELELVSLSVPWINCEFINGKLIEVHLRRNQDFSFLENQQEFVPVWEGDSKEPPEGYQYVDYPEVHRRVGGFVR